MRFNGITWDAMHAIVLTVVRQLLIAMPCVECMRTYVARKQTVPDAVVVIKLAIRIVRILVVIFSDRIAATCLFMMVLMRLNSQRGRGGTLSKTRGHTQTHKHLTLTAQRRMPADRQPITLFMRLNCSKGQGGESESWDMGSGIWDPIHLIRPIRFI